MDKVFCKGLTATVDGTVSVGLVIVNHTPPFSSIRAPGSSSHQLLDMASLLPGI